jgi:hypothetical protein
MITFEIKNTRTENEQLLVFYAFSNGEINSAYFAPTAQVADIMAWGAERAAWFEQREAQIAELQAQLAEASVEVSDGSLNQ